MKQNKSAEVSIDRAVAQIGPRAFALDMIKGVAIEAESVRKERIIPSSGLFLAVGGLFFLSSPSLLEAVVVGAIGVLAYGGFLGTRKLRYHLVLTTASSRVRVFSSDSEDQVLQLRDAIEEAIVVNWSEVRSRS